MPSLTAATPLLPSDIVEYSDSGRVADLLADDGEDAVDIDDIDTNDRALMLVSWAWRYLLMGALRGKLYTERQLIDLANDNDRGQSLRGLVADLFWCRLQMRRRYNKDEPQAEDPACKMAEDIMQALRSGERVFYLGGVTITNSSGNPIGTYSEDEKVEETTIQAGQLGQSNCLNRESRLWGHCTDPCQSNMNGVRFRNGGCC